MHSHTACDQALERKRRGRDVASLRSLYITPIPQQPREQQQIVNANVAPGRGGAQDVASKRGRERRIDLEVAARL